MNSLVNQELSSELQIPTLRAERDRLREQLFEKTNEHSDIRNQVLHLMKEAEELKWDTKNLRRDNDGLRRDNDRLRKDLEIERDEKANLREQIARNLPVATDTFPSQQVGNTFSTGGKSSQLKPKSRSLEIMEIPRKLPNEREENPSCSLSDPPAIRKPMPTRPKPYVQVVTCLPPPLPVKRRQPGVSELVTQPTPVEKNDSSPRKRLRLDETKTNQDNSRTNGLSQKVESKSALPLASSSTTHRKIVSSPLASTTPSEKLVVSDISGVEEKAQKPKVKFKEEALVLPPDVINTYLNSVKTLDITPPPHHLHVPRKFLRLVYGGSDQQLLQFITEDRNPSGRHRRRIVFPMLNMNPAMPMAPGEPGLMFASRHEILELPAWTLFCRHLTSKEAVWQYLGEYESELVGKMTAAQFRGQGEKVRNRWAKHLLEQKAYDVYISMRARIALRKDGLLPVENKEEEDRLVAEEVLAVRTNKGRGLEQDDIVNAFCRGDEGIDIIRMKCVSYDHIFAQDIQAKFPNYDNILSQAAKRKAEDSNQQQKKQKVDHRDKTKSRTSVSIGEESGMQTELEEFEMTPSIRLRRKNRSQWDSKSGRRVTIKRPSFEIGSSKVGASQDDEEQHSSSDSELTDRDSD